MKDSVMSVKIEFLLGTSPYRLNSVACGFTCMRKTNAPLRFILLKLVDLRPLKYGIQKFNWYLKKDDN